MRSACRHQLKPVCPRCFIPLLLIVTVAGCVGNADTEEADVKQIESTISLFSVCLAKADTSTLKEICAPDFILFDEGQTYGLSGLFRSITGILSSNTMARQPVGIQIATRPDGAWSYYDVTGEFTAEGQITSFELIESAYLERNRGGWKIVQVCTVQSATHP